MGNDKDIYVTGSRGTVIKIINNTAKQLLSGSKDELLGIQWLQDQKKFLICGSNGALIYLDNNDNFNYIKTGISDPLYGLDIVDNNIIVVGWKGAALYYNGADWFKLDLGSSSFLEGIVYTGNGKFVSAGWYGRIVEFDNKDMTWKTLQQGRAEKVFSISLTEQGGVLAGLDSGSIIIKPQTGHCLSSGYTNTQDIILTVPIENDRFLILKNNGILSEISITGGTISEYNTEKLADKIDAAVGITDGGIIIAKGKVIKFSSSDSVKNLGNINNLFKDETIQNFAYYNDTFLYIVSKEKSSGKYLLYKTDIINKKREPIQTDEKELIIFGSGDNIKIASKTKLYNIGKSVNPEILNIAADLKSFLINKDDKITAACYVEKTKTCYLGTKCGIVIEYKEDGSILSFSSRSYKTITAINGNDKYLGVGFSRGQVNLIDLNNKKIANSKSVSGPQYRAICRAEKSFIFCSENGVIGFFADNQ